MLVYETKVYLNQFGVKPGSTKWRILQLIRCSFKCLHLGEIKRLFSKYSTDAAEKTCIYKTINQIQSRTINQGGEWLKV